MLDSVIRSCSCACVRVPWKGMRKRTVETMNGRVSGRSGGCWNGPAQETGRPDPRAEVVRILMVPENEVAHVAPR